MELSIIIVNWNVKDLLRKCLLSIFEHKPGFPFEVIVVDNASTDGSVHMVRSEFPHKVQLIVNDENRGFSVANNNGIKHSQGKYILILNPDTEVKSGAISTLVEFLKNHKEAAAVAPRILNPDGTLQESVLSFPTLPALLLRAIFVEALWPENPITHKYFSRDFKYQSIAEVDQPMGAAILFKREIFNKVGLFDEHSFMFFDEVDLCYRIKQAGYKIYFTPQAEIIHHLSKSVQKWGALNLSRNWTRSRNHYFFKHYGPGAVLLLYVFDLIRIILILGLLFLFLFGLFRLL
jgi:hypothetical protein